MLKAKSKSNFDLINDDFLVNPFSDGFSEDILKSSIVQGDKDYKIRIYIGNINPDEIEISLENNNLVVTVYKEDIMISKKSKNFYVGNAKIKEIKQEYVDDELIFTVPIK